MWAIIGQSLAYTLSVSVGKFSEPLQVFVPNVNAKVNSISEKPFFRFESREGSERQLKGFSRTIRSFSDRYLRDNVVVTVYTRNIVGQDIF